MTKVHIIVRFTTHTQDVEFGRHLFYAEVSSEDRHKEDIETYMITICAQCTCTHVLDAHVLPVQQPIPIKCWCCDNNCHTRN